MEKVIEVLDNMTSKRLTKCNNIRVSEKDSRKVLASTVPTYKSKREMCIG